MSTASDTPFRDELKLLHRDIRQIVTLRFGDDVELGNSLSELVKNLIAYHDEQIRYWHQKYQEACDVAQDARHKYGAILAELDAQVGAEVATEMTRGTD